MSEAVRTRAIRGATTVNADQRDEILAATGELLETMLERNAIGVDDLVSAIFTMTPDLHSVFAAEAARALGWRDVPLLCAAGAEVEDALPRCVRVMLHVETTLPRDRIRHVYLRQAKSLRPDLDG